MPHEHSEQAIPSDLDSLRLMRAFLRLRNRDRRLAVIEFAERMGREARNEDDTFSSSEGYEA
jgi:aryl carrier-like protein